MFTCNNTKQHYSVPVILITLLLIAAASTVVCAAGFPVSVKDDFGHTVTLSSRPDRIVSLAPSNTEILFALGLANQVVAVDTDSDYPAAAKKKESIGSGLAPSIEKIAALQPDLVLLWDASSSDVEQKLSRLGIKTATFAPKTLNDVYEVITAIGKLTGTEQAAAGVVDGMKKKVATVVNAVSKANKPLVLYEVWPDPLYTAGPGSLMNEMINLAGGRNLAADAKSAWPVISTETALARDPDVILTPFVKEDSVVGKFKALWSGVKAVRAGRVHQVEQDIVSRPGPRIADGLVQVAKAIHPELF